MKTKKKNGQAMIEYIIVFVILLICTVTIMQYFIRAVDKRSEDSRIMVSAQDP